MRLCLRVPIQDREGQGILLRETMNLSMIGTAICGDRMSIVDREQKNSRITPAGPHQDMHQALRWTAIIRIHSIPTSRLQTNMLHYPLGHHLLRNTH
jgi:hypothetical protein